MNILNRIGKLEKLLARLPAIDPTHARALFEFFYSGCPAVLPADGIERSEILAVARQISTEADLDDYPGLLRIADALRSSRLAIGAQIKNSADCLAYLHALPLDGQPEALIYCDEDYGDIDRFPPTDSERLLSQLGLVQIYVMRHRIPEDGGLTESDKS